MKDYDQIIIGGGFYGLRIGQFLVDELGYKKVLILEKEDSVMQRASYNNQARVHNGYHYPRSVLTALRSRVNFPVFVEEYREAIQDDFTKYYAVASHLSKVSAMQFQRFFERIGSEIEIAKEAKDLFNPKLIEEVFKVKEYAFNTDKLRQKLLRDLEKRSVEIKTLERAVSVKQYKNKILLTTDKQEYLADGVINTTYSLINSINQASNLPIINLKHELTEMCLVDKHPILNDIALTVMCGPFFSLMPFPPLDKYTLSHVRYTPHKEWSDQNSFKMDGHAYMKQGNEPSHFAQMHADLVRYVPGLKDLRYSGRSLWEIKTVLPQSEDDDSRPILYKAEHGNLKGYTCIMGGKIDNIYDVLRELKETYGTAS